MTLGDRVSAALKAAGEQAMRNSNMGQIEAYRITHVISLVEKIQKQMREHCANIAREHIGHRSAEMCVHHIVREIESGEWLP